MPEKPRVTLADAIARDPIGFLEAVGADAEEARRMPTNTYATDGECHYSAPDSLGQECGKPAVQIGVTADGWGVGRCETHKGWQEPFSPALVRWMDVPKPV